MDQPPEVAPTKAGRQAAFRFVFACSLMNAVSFGIMIPVLPNLIKHLVGGDTATAWKAAARRKAEPGTLGWPGATNQA